MDMFRELIELSETTKCIQMMQRTLNEHLEQSNRKMISLFVSLTIRVRQFVVILCVHTWKRSCQNRTKPFHRNATYQIGECVKR